MWSDTVMLIESTALPKSQSEWMQTGTSNKNDENRKVNHFRSQSIWDSRLPGPQVGHIASGLHLNRFLLEHLALIWGGPLKEVRRNPPSFFCFLFCDPCDAKVLWPYRCLRLHDTLSNTCSAHVGNGAWSKKLCPLGTQNAKRFPWVWLWVSPLYPWNPLTFAPKAQPEVSYIGLPQESTAIHWIASALVGLPELFEEIPQWSDWYAHDKVSKHLKGFYQRISVLRFSILNLYVLYLSRHGFRDLCSQRSWLLVQWWSPCCTLEKRPAIAGLLG